MRLALMKAGLWFCSSILVYYFLFGTTFEGKSVQEALLLLAGVGLLFAGTAFFSTWYDIAKEDRRMEQSEQRRRQVFGGEED